MKKLALLLMVLLPLLATAQVGTDNASTPEAFIGQCPDLPSADAAPETVNNFIGTIKKLLDRIDTLQTNASRKQFDAMKTQADETLQKEMGFNTADVMDESPKVKKSIFAKAKEQLRKAGITKDPEKLQQEGMSDKEKNAYAEQMMRKQTGLSMAEAKKLEGMSEKEQRAYMEQHPELMERMMNDGQKAGNSAQLKEINREKKRTEYQQQLEQLTQPEKDFEKLRVQETADLGKKIVEKWKACRASFPPGHRVWVEEMQEYVTYWTKEEEEEVERLTKQCERECWTLWRNLVNRHLARIKTLMPNAYKAQEIAEQMGALDGTPVVENNAPMSVAIKYLTTAENYIKEGYPKYEMPDGIFPGEKEKSAPNS